MTKSDDNRSEINQPTPNSTSEAGARLSAIITRLRRRWRLRLVLGGLFWLLLYCSILLALETWAIQQWHFAPSLIDSLRLVTLLIFAALLWLFCLKSLWQRVSDHRVARYFEEKNPSLNAIVSSAVDTLKAGQQDVSPALQQRLLAQAISASREAGDGDDIESDRINRAIAGNLGLVLVIAATLFLAPGLLSPALSSLLMPWVDATEFSPYRIEVEPGNVEIARGADQLISATIDGFDGSDVRLFTSGDDGQSWQESPLTAGQEPGVYDGFLFDLDRDVDYYVDGAGQRSPVFRVTTADIPGIEAIALRYHYPAYTLLPPELVEGGGDITAIRGTRVEVIITPTGEIPGGDLVFENGSRVALERPASGPWRGSLTVTNDSAYRVALKRDGGAEVAASPEFRITALADGFPSVSVVSPGRDSKVSMIEEPLMAIQASDDQGIAELQLVLSVNGEAETVVPLLQGRGTEANREVDAEHILMLEELDLQPGDLVSYYVRATDRAPAAVAQTSTSDIFFYQVRPFDASFRRADQGGGGGGGGGNQGGQQGGFLSEQQKQFVVATFKMIRDRDEYSDEAYRENLDLLVRAEARIRDRVEAIVRRIGSRALTRVDKRYKVITEELPRAAEKMREVETHLTEAEVRGALADAQVALTHLQRADAVFREMNVSLSQNGGGSGQGDSGFADLANLFQLEMDKLRNQYESVRRGQQQQSPESLIDETLKKLQELARRQQKEVERRMRAQGRAISEQDRQRQLALAEELEKMARQLERLTRQQQNQRLRQSVERMRNAAEAMRRSAAGENGGTEQARSAAEALRQAQQLLDQGKMGQFSEALERTLKRAQLVEKQQSAIRQKVGELDEEWSDKKKTQLERLQQRKEDLTRQLTNLEQEISELTSRSRQQQPKANESLKQAIRAARDYRLRDRIGRTRQMLLLAERQAALDNEAEIQAGIRQMRQSLETALANVGESEERGLERSVERMHEMARELRFLRDRAAQRRQGRQNPGQGQNQARGQQSPGRGGRDASRQMVDGQSGNPMRPELQALAERARGMRDALISQQVSPADVDAVLQKIDALARGGGKDEQVLHDLALRSLMQLEFRLRQRLEQHEYPELFVSDPGELSPEYRQMVADYFRSLSQP